MCVPTHTDMYVTETETVWMAAAVYIKEKEIF